MPRKNLKVLGNSGHPNKARLSHAHNWECASQYARVVTVVYDELVNTFDVHMVYRMVYRVYGVKDSQHHQTS